MIKRRTVAALALSASALVGIVMEEGYSDSAIIPIAGDVPTIGFGTTAGVQIGDMITPQVALVRALDDIQAFEGAIKQCVKVPLAQREYDALVSFSYNIGSYAFCRSTLVKKLNAGDYSGACKEILRWTWAAGRNCRLPESKCYGLVKRRDREYRQCAGIDP